MANLSRKGIYEEDLGQLPESTGHLGAEMNSEPEPQEAVEQIT